jgi:uncharacterized protein (DUF58 family)
VPTRRGIIVLVTGLLLAGLGYGYGYPELVALGAVAVAAFLAALLFAGAKPSLVVDRIVEPERVSRGDPCTAVVNVRSTARWRSQALIGVERLRYAATAADAAASGAAGSWVGQARGDGPGPARGRLPRPLLSRVRRPADRGADGAEPWDGGVPVPMIRLRAGASTFLRYPLPTDRRGVIDVGPMELARRDPLGLVAAKRTYGGVVRMWVHPRSHPLRTVPVGASRSLDGVVDAAQYGSITFHALREYVPGDDLRHVHWRTSAHVGELMVRQHVETSLPRIVVLLDDRAAAYPTGDGFEETVEAAASVLLAALRAELHVELHLVSGRSVTPGVAGFMGAGPYLDLLAEAGRSADASLPAAVQRLRARHRGDTLVLLTGHDGGDLEQVGLLRDVYPTVVAGVIGEGSFRLGGLPGLIVIPAPTAEQFAPRWDGVSRW